MFHVLEHSVLCGSDKYPVKEPFVELLKTSLQTFLNAMTYPAGDGVPRLQPERSGLSQSPGYLSGRGVSQIVHLLYPKHLTFRFERFRHALFFGKPLYQPREHFLCLTINVGKVTAQLAAGK